MECLMRFGPVVFAWRIDDANPRWNPFLDAYAAHFARHSNACATVAIEAAVGEFRPTSKLPPSLIRGRVVRGRDFDLGDGLVRGAVPCEGEVRCTIDPVLLNGNGLRLLEQFFYLLFHEAALVGTTSDATRPFLMHGSAVLSQERVHVFTGPSEAGKSTAAANSRPRAILTDECVAIVPGLDGLCAMGTPVNPFCVERTLGEGPLKGVYLLEKTFTHTLLPVATAEAVTRLVPEVMVPLRLLETDLGVGMGRALDRALLLCRAGLVRRLQFKPDPGFWRLLETN